MHTNNENKHMRKESYERSEPKSRVEKDFTVGTMRQMTKEPQP
jgi:predicted carbohydrate-binding protein with CBM5 and CBM33 domain